ncbi:MAG TPA: SIS domain-containing protein [Anaerolineaceae bacterium]
MRGEYTYKEILSQPEVWKLTLDGFRQQIPVFDIMHNSLPAKVIFTGCGSTYYLSLSAARLFQSLTGVPSVACPGSELLFFPDLYEERSKKTLVVAVSRSGETTETIRAIERIRKLDNHRVMVITCYPESKLAGLSDFLVSIPDAQEVSVAQTRSFSSMTVIAECLAGYLAGQEVLPILGQLPNSVRYLLDKYEPIAKQLGEDLSLDRFFFLGSGFNYGIACEAMLKMKEMSISHSEAYHMMEFRHGPMSMVNENALVVGLISESTRQWDIAVLKHMHQLGGRILAITEQISPEMEGWSFQVEINSGLPDWARTILYLPVLQLMAYYRSYCKGLDPDRPTNLDAVVKLNL